LTTRSARNWSSSGAIGRGGDTCSPASVDAASTSGRRAPQAQLPWGDHPRPVAVRRRARNSACSGPHPVRQAGLEHARRLGHHRTHTPCPPLPDCHVPERHGARVSTALVGHPFAAIPAVHGPCLRAPKRAVMFRSNVPNPRPDAARRDEAHDSSPLASGRLGQPIPAWRHGWAKAGTEQAKKMRRSVPIQPAASAIRVNRF
jgi:hypothetical protein